MIRRFLALATVAVALPLGAQQSTSPRPLPAPVAPMAPLAPMAALSPTLTANGQYVVEAPLAFGQTVNLTYSTDIGGGFRNYAPQAWAQQDPADTLYRQARDQLNRGDYRKAAALFKELPAKFPSSTYALDAYYYQALSLYYIGSTSELQQALDALSALEAQRAKFPRNNRTQNDAKALATRIAGVLASRGLASNDAVKQALQGSASACDQEDVSVRTEALNALMQTEPESGLQLAKRILAKRDECSAPLRRNAVWLLGNRRDASTSSVLIAAAKMDPSTMVRTDAISALARIPGDEALAALQEMARSGDDEKMQRAAVQALASHPNPKARVGIRALVEKNDATESLRLAALDAFDRERSTCDDVAWMRTTYGKVTSTRVRARLASAIGRVGCEGTDAWLAALAKNEDEPLEVRISALRRATEQMDVAGIAKLYDATAQGQIREELINVLGGRKEPEATDKLIDIVKNGTNPQWRRSAINALTRKKDPRTTKLLMELIDRDKED
jgi:HEAT repeat protein